MAAPYNEKYDPIIVPEPLRHSKHGQKLMGPAEVSRISNDKLVTEAPRLTQHVVGVRDGNDLILIAPIMNDCHSVRRNAARQNQPRWQLAEDHIRCRSLKRHIP